MVKKEIRSLYIEKRLRLSSEQFIAASEKIFGHFKKYKWPVINILFSYYPIPGRSEFDVSICEDYLLQKHPALVTTHPRIDDDGRNMTAVAVGQHSAYAPNRYNISEPVEGATVGPEMIDMIFVPLLAFDLHGCRVGYGKGFYDRFLSKCRPDAKKIGFSFFDPVESIDDITRFDVPLNLCITPMRVYEF